MRLKKYQAIALIIVIITTGPFWTKQVLAKPTIQQAKLSKDFSIPYDAKQWNFKIIYLQERGIPIFEHREHPGLTTHINIALLNALEKKKQSKIATLRQLKKICLETNKVFQTIPRESKSLFTIKNKKNPYCHRQKKRLAQVLWIKPDNRFIMNYLVSFTISPPKDKAIIQYKKEVREFIQGAL